MKEAQAYRLDYRRLNKICAYCSRPSTIIRVATTTGGDVIVATMCEEHGIGEQDHSRKNEGFVMAGKSPTHAGGRTDATLLNPDALRAASEKTSDSGIKAIIDDAADRIESVGKNDEPRPIDPTKGPSRGSRATGEN